MASISPAWIQLEPSYMMPELILDYQQQSGAWELIAGSKPQVKLSEGDLLAYVKALSIRSRVQVGQSASNLLPGCTVTPRMISTPTYLMRTRAEWNHHDVAAAARWGYSEPEAQRLGMRQGIAQLMRSALLYGITPSNGEGLLNTQGATYVNLPPDSNGATTVQTYDNGQMSFFLLGVFEALLQRTYQLGQTTEVSLVGPQRDLGAFAIQNIVQVTQFQRQGAGTETTMGVIRDVLARNNIVLNYSYDDTLIGKGSGGTDAIICTLPQIKKPPTFGSPNTNAFADLSPSLAATSVQLVDMAAPREIPTPLPAGAVDMVSEMRMTSGWGIRPEAITVVSMQYQ